MLVLILMDTKHDVHRHVILLITISSNETSHIRKSRALSTSALFLLPTTSLTDCETLPPLESVETVCVSSPCYKYALHAYTLRTGRHTLP